MAIAPLKCESCFVNVGKDIIRMSIEQSPDHVIHKLESRTLPSMKKLSKKKPVKSKSELVVIGWREWIRLPDLGGVQIKAKVDTGARTSALHAWNIKKNERGGKHYVEFDLHPLQRDNKHIVRCSAPLVDRREIRSSSGEAQERYVIQTIAEMGVYRWPIELSLTRRDEMGFRMLLGRTAMKGRFLINPQKSFLMGKN